jgi:hypothetical protein
MTAAQNVPVSQTRKPERVQCARYEDGVGQAWANRDRLPLHASSMGGHVAMGLRHEWRR